MGRNTRIFEQDFDQKNTERSAEIHLEILIIRLGSMLNRENGAVVSAIDKAWFWGYVAAHVEAGLISADEAARILARASSIIESYELEAAALDAENQRKAQASIKPLGKLFKNTLKKVDEETTAKRGKKRL